MFLLITRSSNYHDEVKWKSLIIFAESIFSITQMKCKINLPNIFIFLVLNYNKKIYKNWVANIILHFNTTFVFFSACGNFLATQGEMPDHLLTIWDWREETKLASKPSPASQHYQISFAHGQHNKNTTCGNIFLLAIQLLMK